MDDCYYSQADDCSSSEVISHVPAVASMAEGPGFALLLPSVVLSRVEATLHSVKSSRFPWTESVLAGRKQRLLTSGANNLLPPGSARL